MDRRAFGRTAFSVPAIGLGTWRSFDVQAAAAERACAEVVTVALDAGAGFFDSAAMYGEAERVLGQALRGRREQALVATKVWAHSVEAIQAQVERALELFEGRVDVYQVHNLVRWETCLPILQERKVRGQVGAIGITAYGHSAFPTMCRILETGRVDAVQLPYNAADRRAEEELLPLAQALGIGVIVMRPLGEGELARRQPPRAAWRALGLERFGIETWPQALLKWIVSDPRVQVAIPATASAAHMAQNAAAGEPPFFDEETREAIARLVARRAG
jgi:aryl-alcohol dehydrogenase-like predicted oxidoreductase